MTDRAKRRRPLARALRLAAWTAAVSFGLLLALVVAAILLTGFSESASRGWERVGALGIALLAILTFWVLLALAFEAPKVLAWKRMQRQTTDPVYLVRRPLDLPDRLTALLRSSPPAPGWEEFFIAVLADARLEVRRARGKAELLASVEWIELEGADLRAEESYVGRVDRISCASRETGQVIVLPLRARPLGTSRMRRPQLIEVLDQFERRIAASAPERQPNEAR